MAYAASGHDTKHDTEWPSFLPKLFNANRSTGEVFMCKPTLAKSSFFFLNADIILGSYKVHKLP